MFVRIQPKKPPSIFGIEVGYRAELLNVVRLAQPLITRASRGRSAREYRPRVYHDAGIEKPPGGVAGRRVVGSSLVLPKRSVPGDARARCVY